MSEDMPGVHVTERLLDPQGGESTEQVVAAFVGQHHRGPTVPRRVASWSQFTRWFGQPQGADPLGFALHGFFANGGGEAFVHRPRGSGAATASRLFQNRETESADTLLVEAHNFGAWGNDLFISIEDGSYEDLFSLFVYYGGSDPRHYVEGWEDLSLDREDERFVEDIVNSQRGGSSYIRVTSLDQGLPAPQTQEQLAGGLDGDPPTATDLDSAIHELDSVSNPILLNVPSEHRVDYVNNALAYAEGRADIFVVIDPPSGQTPDEIVVWADSLNPSTSYGAVYFPRLLMSDFRQPSKVRTIAPGGHVLGQYVRTDTVRGVHKAPAGYDTRIAGAAGTEVIMTSNELANLNRNHVNAIRHVPGAGVIIMGARTLRRTRQSDRYVSVRRTLIYVRRSLVDLTGFALFEPNDENLWASMRASVSSFLRDFWQDGGLRGSQQDEAFFVKCDGDLNPPEAVASGVVRMDVGVAPQHPAEFVIIRLGQVAGGATVTEVMPGESV